MFILGSNLLLITDLLYLPVSSTWAGNIARNITNLPIFFSFFLLFITLQNIENLFSFSLVPLDAWQHVKLNIFELTKKFLAWISVNVKFYFYCSINQSSDKSIYQSMCSFPYICSLLYCIRLYKFPLSCSRSNPAASQCCPYTVMKLNVVITQYYLTIISKPRNSLYTSECKQSVIIGIKPKKPSTLTKPNKSKCMAPSQKAEYH